MVNYNLTYMIYNFLKSNYNCARLQMIHSYLKRKEKKRKEKERKGKERKVKRKEKKEKKRNVCILYKIQNNLMYDVPDSECTL